KEYLDGTLVDIQEAKCKPLLPNLYYDCKLYFSRAIPELKPRILHFVLDSITLSDQLGNAIELTTEDQLKPLFGGKLLRYTFYSGRPKKGEVEQEHPNEDMIKWPVVSE
ncbi:MAG: hypothetical protein JNK65_05730, partial [Deltaproteobacteria bacterium]|nr:hypothetical protein [Deltaproteobacteria bacterium]